MPGTGRVAAVEARPVSAGDLMNRRSFLSAILAAGVAPALVRADSLMRIVPRETTLFTVGGQAAIDGLDLSLRSIVGDLLSHAGFSLSECDLSALDQPVA